MNIKIRPIKKFDLKSLMKIERVSFPTPWEESDFRTVLSADRTEGIIVETHSEVVGYMIFHFDKGRYQITSMAVAPHMRRKRIGFAMFEHLVIKLNDRRSAIEATASDSNLESHLFFRSLGFRAEKVLRDFYGPGHDGYEFVYNVGTPYKDCHEKVLDEACQGR